MKLGLADLVPPRPPAILVLGEGAVSSQIRNDLGNLGLTTYSVDDLPLTAVQKQLPRIHDPDAALHMRKIFETFRGLDESKPHEHGWIHPGVTIWGERSEIEGWARQCGLSAITAASKNLQLFWNTYQVLKLAKQQGIPTLVLSDDPVTSTREIETAIRKLVQDNRAMLPFVLKSAYRARGGFGSRVIKHVDELGEWVPIWMNQIRETSGATLLFFERYLESARCYVQPFVRMKSGEMHFFPVVDGSLMYEGKNWIEVCPAQSIDESTREKIESYSKTITQAADFVGVGSLVFLSNGHEVYFTEALARLNFGYRLWETVANTNALEWQLLALAPALLPVAPTPKAPEVGELCGINLKINAEDTLLKIPHPGQIHELSQKTEWNESGAEANLIWDVAPGQHVDWKSSGSLGQVTLFAHDWKDVLKLARRVLKEIWISGGVQTNERFLLELLTHPWVQESMFYTGFVDEEFIPKQLPDVAWLQTMANAIAEIAEPLAVGESYLWMNHRLPEASGPLSWTQKAEIEMDGLKGVKGYFQNDAGITERMSVFPIHSKRLMIRYHNWFFSIRRSEKGKPLQLMALTSGRVHSVFFREGAVVDPKQSVIILESHQNLVSHRLPIAVKITKLFVRAEDEVLIGQPLAEIERWSDHQN